MALTDTPDVYLKDFGVACVFGGNSFLGIFDTPDQTFNQAGINVVSRAYTLLVKTSDAVAAAIANGSSGTVAGTTYVVRDVLRVDDGLFTQLELSL